MSQRTAAPVDDNVQLRLVPQPARTFTPAEPGEPAPLAEASRAVPLLWLGLFDYEEAEVRPSGKLDVFAAVTPAKKAAKRAAALGQALPEQPSILRGTAEILAWELGQAPEGHHVGLFPEGVFHALKPEGCRAYLEQLFDLCALWQQVREGLEWSEAERQLHQLFPDLFKVLERQESRVAGYYLVGSLVDKLDSLEPYLVREGQGEQDLEPEALAVGEMGLLLGRFGGSWKLMSSGTPHDLLGVWSDGRTAYLVGQQGTVVRLRHGRSIAVEVPTTGHLNAVWGLSSRFVCAVGGGGVVLAYNGSRWQPWAVPTQAPLHAMAGTAPDNICVAGQEPALYRFDGHGWNRMPLPEEGLVNALCACNGTLVGAGGARRGGAVYRLERGGWTRDTHAPSSDWLEGIWAGWGDEVGVVAGTGPALVTTPDGWAAESLPAERIAAVASGAHVMAVGSSGSYDVILRRTEGGWRVEASLRGLRLSRIWVAGRPKPPRRRPNPSEKQRDSHA